MSFCSLKLATWRVSQCLLFSLLVTRVSGAILQWEASGEPEVAGYKAYIGTESQTYTRVLDAKLQTWVTLSGLDAGITYYFATTAYDAIGLESDFSQEIDYTPPVDGNSAVLLPFSFEMTGEGVLLRISGKAGQRCWIVASSDLRSWQQVRSFTFSDSAPVEISDPAGQGSTMRFYRVIASNL